MAKFQDVELVWKGRKFRVPSKQVMGMIAKIEDHVTMTELARFQAERGGALPFAKLANGFSAAIEYAGGEAPADEVYLALCGGGDSLEEGKAVALAVRDLLALMTPPEAVAKALAREAAANKAGEAKAAPAKSQRSGLKRSKARTRP